MSKNLKVFIGIGILSFGVLSGVVFFQTSGRGERKVYNIILISIDTLRTDHTGVYGYKRNTTPALDQFAKESIVFEQAITQATFSMPSYASIFTSQYPEVHGAVAGLIVKNPYEVLDPSKLMLAEVLKSQGYKTAAFVGTGELSAQLGFAQGFEVYKDQERSFSKNIPLALNWLEENKDKEFFLFMHGYDVHHPYTSPEPFVNTFDQKYQGIFTDHERFFPEDALTNPLHETRKDDEGRPVMILEDKAISLNNEDMNHVIAHYDGAILYVDSLLQDFFDRLKRLNLYNNSIIIILGDHGESLGELLLRPLVQNLESIFGHGIVHEEVIHVPLIIRHPDLKPRRIFSQAQLIDVFPTVVESLNLPFSSELKKRIQGKSLIPLIKGKSSLNVNKYVYVEGSGIYDSVARTTEWKLIKDAKGNFELYHLKTDPKETENVVSDYPKIVEELKQKLEAWKLTNLAKKA